MSNVNNLRDLRTRVRNISGVTKIFGYLNNKHGKELLSNEEHYEEGNLFQKLSGSRDKRRLDALYSDIMNGHLAIMHTPNVTLYDPQDDSNRAIRVYDGAVIVDWPSYQQFKSSGVVGGDN